MFKFLGFLEEVERYLLRLQGKRVQSKEDKSVWVGAKDGKFSVKRLYNDLVPRRLTDFPSKVISKSRAPSKVGIFSWVATWSRILSLDNV